MLRQDELTLEKYRKSIFRIAPIIIILLSLGALIRYLLNSLFQLANTPDYIPMAPATSISFLIIVFSLYGYHKDYGKDIITTMISLTGIFAILEVIGFLLDQDLNYEEKIFATNQSFNKAPLGLMSISTAIMIIIACLTILMLIYHEKHLLLHRSVGYLAMFGTGIAFVFTFAYILGSPFMYNHEGLIPMALSTAVSFGLLFHILISEGPDEYFPLKYYFKDNQYSKLLASFLPINFVSLLIGLILFYIIDNTLPINPAFPAAIAFVIIMVLTSIVVEKNSNAITQRLQEYENDKIQAERSLNQTKERLQHLDKIETLGHLAGGISHDFNNILQSIKGYLFLVQRDIKKLDKKDNTSHFEVVSERMEKLNQIILESSQLTEQILLLSNHRGQEQVLDVKDVLQSVKDIICSTIDRRIDLNFYLPDDKLTIFGNKSKLIQIFMNLILNSIDVMPKGGSIDITASLEIEKLDIDTEQILNGWLSDKVNCIFGN